MIWTILLIAAMIATVVALVRGIIAFLQTTEADLNSDSVGPSLSAQRQNKMMMQRVIFQGLAILIVCIILLAARG
jgi:hypothetical protein